MPASVIERASDALRLVPETGLLLLGISHCTSWFRAVVEEAEAAGITGLEGPRSISGQRASLYNAVSLESVRVPAGFLRDFQRRCG